MWVAVGDNDSGNGNIMYSYDGISWSDSVGGNSFSTIMELELLTEPVRTELSRCGWLLGYDGDDNGNIMYSYDGISWSDSVGGNAFSISGGWVLLTGPDGDGTPMWVAVGSQWTVTSNGNIMYSYDGISWSDSVGGTYLDAFGNWNCLRDQFERN